MYDEVLKQGSKIVDGLSSYKQPVFVYIVPNGELQGGAWVVLGVDVVVSFFFFHLTFNSLQCNRKYYTTLPHHNQRGWRTSTPTATTTSTPTTTTTPTHRHVTTPPRHW